MDYVIRNNKNLYIKLNENGAPITCAEHEKALFEHSKAKNIFDSLPKTLRRLKFKVEPIPEIVPRVNQEAIKEIKETVLENKDYELSDNILRWVDKFGSCYDILNEAKHNFKILVKELEYLDKELLDILHSIEMEQSKDLYGSWKVYKSIRENRKKRRMIKDEMLIIQNVLEKIDPASLNREQVQKAIDGLFKRKYRFRIVDEEEEQNSPDFQEMSAKDFKKSTNNT